MAPTREQIESFLVEALQVGLGDGIPVEPLPWKSLMTRVRAIQDAAVFVVYAGGDFGRPDNRARVETLSWSLLVCSVDYRSAQARAGAALGVLQACVDIIDKSVGPGVRMWPTGDRVQPAPEEAPNLFVYELSVAVELRRTLGR